jgi:citrate synthase
MLIFINYADAMLRRDDHGASDCDDGSPGRDDREGWDGGRMTEWIGAAEAAARLGIKPASLYAYVSRGVLSRRQDPGGRASLFDAEEIARLARKGRPRRGPAGAELIIESALTEITGSHLRYRGYDAVQLAGRYRYEQIATFLWTGTGLPAAPEALDGVPLTDAIVAGVAGAGATAHSSAADAVDGHGARRVAPAWTAAPAALAAGRAAQAALPAATLPLERLQVIVPALAATDPLRLNLDRPAVLTAARSLIAGMVGCLPGVGQHDDPGAGQAGVTAGTAGPAETDGTEIGGTGGAGGAGGAETSGTSGTETGGVGGPDGVDSIAVRLTWALCPEPPMDGLVQAVQTALVLLADHELAASTLAARVAASMRADPYAVVATGLGALGGSLHGGAALGAELMLASAVRPEDAPQVVGDLLRRGERIPGFGHFVYKNGDPRAVALMRVIQQHAPDSPRLAVASAVLAQARRYELPEPNIDFALATLTGVAGMAPGAGEAVFAVARAAGWIAHALEEYERRAPIRPRSIYTGPAAQPAS